MEENIESDEKGFIPSTPDEMELLPNYTEDQLTPRLDESSPATLLKHQAHLYLDTVTAEFAVYTQAASEDGSVPPEAVSIRHDIYEGLGRPSDITISVRAGNRIQ